ncbi:SDR family oxidoreductase [Cryptosporangium arvum]|uniref:Ketoreductase domain-containing protein n=1 Tax=Cryptosporangium arvum DSM 44712 TaxID=927661 RepID=A0A010Z3D8_9ACTN|nr:SDR family oxidoreductase [Cryptosporangium arvum]EXG81923.1 short-chain dehydrogenase of unknown substrate specificity [Cryptosporangium arvum DSM 44712]
MPKPMSEQVVVITGASTGIGRATALTLAGRGAKVVAAARNEGALASLVADARGDVLAVPTDVSDAAAVHALADAAESRYGRIDTWVNNAAVAMWGRIEDISGDEFDRVMRVNFLGQVHGVHAALPALRRSGGGGIIGVASVESIRAVPLQAPYSASKFALQAFYECLRIELAQEGSPISVSTVLPAAIDTPLYDHGRSKLGARPKPPPPVYAAELVAEAITRAVERPRREIPVGDSALGFYLGQRISPALADGFMAIRRLAKTSQMYGDRADNGVDNLDKALDEPGRVHGSYPGRVLRHSLLTQLAARVPRPGELLTSAVNRLHAR